jgi:hypothetical protein
MHATLAPSVSVDFKYTQQETLVENVLRYVSCFRAQSLLDIGAGAPSTALPISKSVRDYLAIESDPSCANELRCAGLNVLQERFPFPMFQTFDLVLSSHSVPEGGLFQYQGFLSSAWRLVKTGGVLLVVTFKGSGGDVRFLREELACSRRNECTELNEIVHILSKFASVQIERVNSYATTSVAEDIVSYFLPWICPEAGERYRMSKDFRHIVETRYKVRPSYYVFPTEHLFISCRS